MGMVLRNLRMEPRIKVDILEENRKELAGILGQMDSFIRESGLMD